MAVDGTKMRAVNSRDQNFNQSKLEELIERAEARLAEYFAQLDASDASEAEQSQPSRAELEQKIAVLEEKQDWHKELLAQIQTGEEQQVSVTDPDSRRMRSSAGSVVGYNAQSVVDAKHKLIAAADVTNEATDVRQLGSMAIQAKENLQIEKAEVLADAGYYNNAEVAACLERGLTPYVPKADTSANSAQGLFGKSRFRFDAAKDVYICPGNQELNYRFSTYELGRSLRYYRASGCKQCVLKSQCTRNKANRTITREAQEHLMEQMAERMRQAPQKIKQRKGLVEHPFGTIKRALGYDHFLLKGLEKVRTEWSLITLAYNFKRVLNLVSLPKLLEAVA
jgi:hypothetical protein